MKLGLYVVCLNFIMEKGNVQWYSLNKFHTATIKYVYLLCLFTFRILNSIYSIYPCKVIALTPIFYACFLYRIYSVISTKIYTLHRNPLLSLVHFKTMWLYRPYLKKKNHYEHLYINGRSSWKFYFMYFYCYCFFFIFLWLLSGCQKNGRQILFLKNRKDVMDSFILYI